MAVFHAQQRSRTRQAFLQTKRTSQIIVILVFVVAGQFMLNLSTRRKLRALRSSTVEKDDHHISCQNHVPPRDFDETQVDTIYSPGYPGSGSEMFRELILALTGREASTEFYDLAPRCEPHAPTCKTHHTSPKISNFPETGMHPRIFLLLRNPRKALPSFVNYEYEGTLNLTHHKEQAPEPIWNLWRDQFFDSHIRLWGDLILEWSRAFEVAAFLSYEEMTKEPTGPLLLHKVAKELQAAHSSVSTDVDCLWHRVVMEKGANKRSARQYNPGFTKAQQTMMIEILESVKRAVPSLATTMEDYILDVRLNTRVVDDPSAASAQG